MYQLAKVGDCSAAEDFAGKRPAAHGAQSPMAVLTSQKHWGIFPGIVLQGLEVNFRIITATREV